MGKLDCVTYNPPPVSAFSEFLFRTPVCGCDVSVISAAAAARGQIAGISEKSQKVKKN